MKFAVSCKKRFRRGRSFGCKLLQKICVYQTFLRKALYGRIPYPPTLDVAVYGMMCDFIEIVLLLCFPNLLAYGFAVFSKFAMLTLANLEKGYFVWIL